MSRLQPPCFVPAEVVSLAPFVDAGVLGPAEVHLAAWVARATGSSDHHLVLGVAMAAWAARHGHSCAALDRIAAVVERSVGQEVFDDGAEVGDADPVRTAGLASLEWPVASQWSSSLTGHGAVVRMVDTCDAEPVLDARPLVLIGHHLYLQRHWVDECTIATSVRARAVEVGRPIAVPALELLDRLLPPTIDGEPNLQRTAADTVLASHLAVVAGGPGTGKTFSVARILAVVLTHGLHSETPVRVALAAPTGKAAARLKESIDTALASADVRAAVPEPVLASLAALTPTTIHRLLGPKGGQLHRFRHDASDPLRYDLVVIDETSMVSAPLLARLCEAVRPDARLVLIGDPDQLESVELGAVLGDMVTAGEHDGPLAGRVVRLERVHRYDVESPIARVADAVRSSGTGERGGSRDRPGVLDVLAQPTDGLQFIEVDDAPDRTARDAVRAVVAPVWAEVRAAAEVGDIAGALNASARVRILCAHRHGPYGVSRWNELAAQWQGGGSDAWYPGRPLLVTRNEPRLGLANGDVGVVVRDGDSLVAAFGTAEHPHCVDPVQLDQVETAFALTIHKSQGSEYPTVVVVVPPATSPLVGRELLYTAVTRAREALVVVGSRAAVESCAATPAHRMTGLAAALSGDT